MHKAASKTRTPPARLRLQWPRASRVLPAKRRLQEVLQRVWDEHDQPAAAVEVNFVDEATISRLHREYLDDPSPTDIITFDLGRAPDQSRVAALYICTAAARRHAARFRVTPGEEIRRLVIHGVLHLLGYHDHSPQQRRKMRRRENRVLKLLSE